MAIAASEQGSTNGRVAIDIAENPLHRLSDEQIEAIGRELDELHEQIKADLGNRDSTYIRSVIAMQRRLALLGRATLLASRWRAPWALGTAMLSLAKILENMEIGHNVLHGQWDWMNDPVINSSNWDWDTASTAEAWKHSHNYIHHTYTNILGKDKDLGYEIMRIDARGGRVEPPVSRTPVRACACRPPPPRSRRGVLRTEQPMFSSQHAPREVLGRSGTQRRWGASTGGPTGRARGYRRLDPPPGRASADR